MDTQGKLWLKDYIEFSGLCCHVIRYTILQTKAGKVGKYCHYHDQNATDVHVVPVQIVRLYGFPSYLRT